MLWEGDEGILAGVPGEAFLEASILERRTWYVQEAPVVWT